MSLELSSPYSNQELEEIVSLEPYQMNNNRLLNLKNNLKYKVLNKCNKYGYITFVHNIVSCGNGKLDANNLSGNAVYKVKYFANICIPINNTQILVHMDIIDNKIIKGSNGPIYCIVLSKNINMDKFKIKNNGEIVHIETDASLKKGDYVKVNILASQFNGNDSKINIIGWLDDLATNVTINNFLCPKYDNNDNDNDNDNVNDNDNTINTINEK
jgi:DNA-directed RNA polymerase subunit E'/Rpb7